jgi:DNA repair protein RecN (Recombination protein N)
VTEIKQLSEQDRVRAIATMLSQNPPTESALANARELLNF